MHNYHNAHLGENKIGVITLAAWRKILKQVVNFCGASELMPPFRRNIF